MRYIKLYEDFFELPLPEYMLKTLQPKKSPDLEQGKLPLFEGLELPKNFEEECKPFIDKLKKCTVNNLSAVSMSLYYRGIKDLFIKSHPNIFEKIINDPIVYRATALVDRIPVDTPIDAHNEFNKEFHRVFGWYVRNGTFTYRNRNRVSGYGESYIFVPIGDFDFCWSTEYRDFFADLEDELRSDLSDYDNFVESQEDIWDSEYNEDSGNGTWYFKPTGFDTGERWFDNAVEIVKKENPDYVEKQSDFEWEPEVSLDDYLFQAAIGVDFEKNRQKRIREIVSEYNDTEFNAHSNNEVSFNCEKYYLFDTRYEDTLTKLVWGS